MQQKGGMRRGGRRQGGIAAYSTDIAAAWQLVDALAATHALRLTYGIWRENGEKQVGWRADFGPFGASSKTCETAPHAVCLAALLATLPESATLENQPAS
jgi:hypothetical protein